MTLSRVWGEVVKDIFITLPGKEGRSGINAFKIMCPHFGKIMVLRESFPRQVGKKSRGPQGKRGLEFSRRRKGQTVFPLHALGLYNNNVSCLRTVSGLNLLANPVILKCKLWE